MTRENALPTYKKVWPGRRATLPAERKEVWIDGELVDVTPEPGRTFTRQTWPPPKRGRGESLLSPRRVEAKLRAVEAIKLRKEGMTWAKIAAHLGYSQASGAFKAVQRMLDRYDVIEQQQRSFNTMA